MDVHSFVDARESAPTLAQALGPAHSPQRLSVTSAARFIFANTPDKGGDSTPQIAYAF
jgi:hypothetical protein